jgi:hypothetical protein
VSGSASAFGYELRVLACDHCGAPVGAALAGGAVPCRYCGAENHIRPRDDRPNDSAPAESEALRVERLREQDKSPMPPPPGLADLLVDDRIPGERMDRARDAWRAARSELAAGGGLPSAERLFYLTLAQLNHLADEDRDEDLRSLLETGLEHLEDPRHRQVLHGWMAEMAARAGDIAAAKRWLSLCTPHADDLRMDTIYRVAKAYIATADGDFKAVIHALGFRPQDVPLADEHEELAALLRANAHERAGRSKEAMDELFPIALRGHLERLRRRHARLALCPLTMGLAEERAAALRKDAVTLMALEDANMAWPIFVLKAYGASVVLAAIVSAVLWQGGILLAVVAVGMVVSIFGGAIARSLYDGRVRKTYVDGWALAISQQLDAQTNQKGWRWGHMAFLIQPRGGEPYYAEYKAFLSDNARTRSQPGGTIPVQVPTDRRLVHFRWSDEA